jgi:hypothetical protein
MDSNTALVIIAIAAALGLMTTLLVVAPSVPQAFAQGVIPDCPTQSPRGSGSPSIQHGCGPAVVPPPR